MIHNPYKFIPGEGRLRESRSSSARLFSRFWTSSSRDFWQQKKEENEKPGFQCHSAVWAWIVVAQKSTSSIFFFSKSHEEDASANPVPCMAPKLVPTSTTSADRLFSDIACSLSNSSLRVRSADSISWKSVTNRGVVIKLGQSPKGVQRAQWKIHVVAPKEGNKNICNRLNRITC